MQFFWQHCQQLQPPKCRYLPGVHHILKTPSSAIFSVCHSQIPEVRPHSCDDLSTLHRFIACIKIARVHGGWSFDNNFDERAWRPTSNFSNTQANSFADGCCAQPRPDGLGRFSQKFPTRDISQHIPTKFPRARSSIIAMRHDVTVEFVNSKFSKQVFGECFQRYFNFFSSADGLNCMFQISAGHGG